MDYLQVESTYGAREHAPKLHANDEVGRLVRATLEQKGKVIIPSFSVGRTQQIVYTLHQLTLAGQLPRVPIFVDSPLSVNATEVYRLHPECFNESIYKFLREKENPFGMENLTYIREVAHSMKLNDLKDPAIIISASGMAEAGRIRHHLANHIGNPENLILFIGYCAEHTLGAQILVRPKPGQHLRRAPQGPRPDRLAGLLLRPCGQERTAALRRGHRGRHQDHQRHSWRRSAGAGLRRDAARAQTQGRGGGAGVPGGGGNLKSEVRNRMWPSGFGFRVSDFFRTSDSIKLTLSSTLSAVPPCAAQRPALGYGLPAPNSSSNARSFPVTIQVGCAERQPVRTRNPGQSNRASPRRLVVLPGLRPRLVGN